MGNKDSKFADEIKSVTKLFKELVLEIRSCTRNFLGIDAMKQALEKLQKLNETLNDEEKQILEKIIEANKMSSMTIQSANDAVLDTQKIVKTIRNLLQANAGTLNVKVEMAIKVYIRRIEGLLPKFETAKKALIQSAEEMKAVSVKVQSLQGWCDKKLKEIEDKKENEVIKERGAAYGGAASVVVGVGGLLITINIWNPIGWIVGLTTVGITATTTVATALGVTEGVTVKQLQTYYNERKDEIRSIGDRFTQIADAASATACCIDTKTKQLMDIAAVAKNSAEDGKDVLEIDVDEILFGIFKDDIEELEKMCDEYLSAGQVSCAQPD